MSVEIERHLKTIIGLEESIGLCCGCLEHAASLTSMLVLGTVAQTSLDTAHNAVERCIAWSDEMLEIC